VELSVSGDTAYEIGNYTEKFHPKGKESFEVKGKYSRWLEAAQRNLEHSAATTIKFLRK
jgi:hypothetical protein